MDVQEPPGEFSVGDIQVGSSLTCAGCSSEIGLAPGVFMFHLNCGETYCTGCFTSCMVFPNAKRCRNPEHAPMTWYMTITVGAHDGRSAVILSTKHQEVEQKAHLSPTEKSPLGNVEITHEKIGPDGVFDRATTTIDVNDMLSSENMAVLGPLARTIHAAALRDSEEDKTVIYSASDMLNKALDNDEPLFLFLFELIHPNHVKDYRKKLREGHTETKMIQLFMGTQMIYEMVMRLASDKRAKTRPWFRYIGELLLSASTKAQQLLTYMAAGPSRVVPRRALRHSTKIALEAGITCGKYDFICFTFDNVGFFRSGSNASYLQTISMGYTVVPFTIFREKIYGTEALSREPLRKFQDLNAADFLPNADDFEKVRDYTLAMINICLENHDQFPTFDECKKAVADNETPTLSFVPVAALTTMSKVEVDGEQEDDVFEIEITTAELADDSIHDDVADLLGDDDGNQIDDEGADSPPDDTDEKRVEVQTHFTNNNFQMMKPDFQNLASTVAVTGLMASFGKVVKEALSMESTPFTTIEEINDEFVKKPIMESMGFHVFGDNSPAHQWSVARSIARQYGKGSDITKFSVQPGDYIDYNWKDAEGGAKEYKSVEVISKERDGTFSAMWSSPVGNVEASDLEDCKDDSGEFYTWRAGGLEYADIIRKSEMSKHLKYPPPPPSAAAAAAGEPGESAPAAGIAADARNAGDETGAGDGADEDVRDFFDADDEKFALTNAHFQSGGFHLLKELTVLNGKLNGPAFLRYLVQGWRPSTAKQDWFLTPGDPTQTLEEMKEYRHAIYHVAAIGALLEKPGNTVSATEVNEHMVKCATKSKLAMSMLISLRFIEVIYMLLDSERESDAALYQSVLRLTLPLMCITNATKYARTFSEEMRSCLLMSPAEYYMYKTFSFTKKTVNGKNIFQDRYFEWAVKYIRSFSGKKLADVGNSKERITDINVNLPELLQKRRGAQLRMVVDRNDSTRPTADPNEDSTEPRKKGVTFVFLSTKVKLMELNVWRSDGPDTEVDERYLDENQRSQHVTEDYENQLVLGSRRAKAYVETYVLSTAAKLNAQKRQKVDCNISLIPPLTILKKRSAGVEVEMATTTKVSVMKRHKEYNVEWYKVEITRLKQTVQGGKKSCSSSQADKYGRILSRIPLRLSGLSKIELQSMLAEIRRLYYAADPEAKKRRENEVEDEMRKESNCEEAAALKKSRDTHPFLTLKRTGEGTVDCDDDDDDASDEGGDEYNKQHKIDIREGESDDNPPPIERTFSGLSFGSSSSDSDGGDE